jgi:hypothetical protein
MNKLAYLCVVLFVLGVGLLVPFDASLPRTLGVLCLLSFIAVGIFVLARPDNLGK